MERKIGEIFEFGGEWYQCVNQNGCCNCAFYNTSCHLIDELSCNSLNKKRKEKYIFKKLEKVGEPYISSRNKKRYQLYRFFCLPITKDMRIEIGGTNCVGIEIKQNKEDMEEKKPTYEELLHYYHSTVGLWAIDRSPQEISLAWICDNAFQLGIDEKHSNSEKVGKNLKPFDLQKAREGKSVCTRDGRKARILCYDFKQNEEYPILVAVENKDGKECALLYSNDGISEMYKSSNNELAILPEKKEGWVNVYKKCDGEYYVEKVVYKIKGHAVENASSQNYVGTVRIEFYE